MGWQDNSWDSVQGSNAEVWWWVWIVYSILYVIHHISIYWRKEFFKIFYHQTKENLVLSIFQIFSSKTFSQTFHSEYAKEACLLLEKEIALLLLDKNVGINFSRKKIQSALEILTFFRKRNKVLWGSLSSVYSIFDWIFLNTAQQNFETFGRGIKRWLKFLWNFCFSYGKY